MSTLHIVHTESSCGWGGQEIRILTEAQGMLARGHRVTLLCPAEAKICGDARRRGIPTVALPIARKNLRGLLALRAWLAANRQDISLINTHSSTDSWLSALACATLTAVPPLVRTRHVSSPVKRNVPTSWLYQKAASHVVTTGEALRRQLGRDNGFALDRMTSVPTGIDLAWFRPMEKREARRVLALPEEGLLLGILGTLRNWKGHVYLFHALAALLQMHPVLRLLVIGEGPQRHNLEKLAAELGIAHAVHFAGNRDDAPLWLNALDVFVLPSYGDEGVPQSIMQAMACGLPVISTPVGAIAEAVVDGETGLLVPPRDSGALAEALERLVLDPGLRVRLGRAGLARAQERFGLDIMLDRMEAVFRAAVGGRP